MTPQQMRAARALLGWSREVLAKKARIHHQTVTGFELLERQCELSTLHKMRRALEVAGVEFIDERAASLDGGSGVRLRRSRGKR